MCRDSPGSLRYCIYSFETLLFDLRQRLASRIMHPVLQPGISLSSHPSTQVRPCPRRVFSCRMQICPEACATAHSTLLRNPAYLQHRQGGRGSCVMSSNTVADNEEIQDTHVFVRKQMALVRGSRRRTCRSTRSWTWEMSIFSSTAPKSFSYR